MSIEDRIETRLHSIEQTLMELENTRNRKPLFYTGRSRRQRSAEAGLLRDGAPACSAAAKTERILRSRPQGEFTLTDYRLLRQEKRFELIDGVLFEMAMPSLLHQHIVSACYLTISDFLRTRNLPFRAFEGPVDVQLDRDDKTMVQPDLVIVCDLSQIKGFGIFGAPAFVLEVLSSLTRTKDLRIKPKKYVSAGVKECWILDPQQAQLLICDNANGETQTKILPLNGSASISVLRDECRIDLDEISALTGRAAQRR